MYFFKFCNGMVFQMADEKQSLVANLESVKAEVDFNKGQLDLAKCAQTSCS